MREREIEREGKWERKNAREGKSERGKLKERENATSIGFHTACQVKFGHVSKKMPHVYFAGHISTFWPDYYPR
jgi:hypothetical protein